jgi:pimeloyl-ACP methyl ester carboxylesterase
MHIFHNNSKVAYQKVGQGQILVLLHGFCEDSTMWADFVPLLSKKYTILTIDLSGFGHSDLLENTSITTMADATLAVLEFEKVNSCILIGHSMGGYVSLAVAQKKPQILLGLGLFHSHPYKDSSSKTHNRLKTIRFIERHGIAPFAGHFVRNLFPPPFVEDNKLFVEELIHKTSMHHSDAVLAASHAMIERDNRTDVLTNLACPALFIVGTLDNAIPVEHSLKQLSLPNISSVHILENVGHMGMFEAPVETLEIIVDFIEFCNTYAPTAS